MSNQPPLSPAPVRPFSHQFLPSLHIIRDNRELKQRRPRRQRARQKSSRFISKTTTLYVHHAFLYISLPSLHNHDATWKCLISRYMEDVNKRRRIYLSLFKLEYGPQRNQLWGNSPSFGIFSDLEQTRQSLKKRGFIYEWRFHCRRCRRCYSSLFRFEDENNHDYEIWRKVFSRIPKNRQSGTM